MSTQPYMMFAQTRRVWRRCARKYPDATSTTQEEWPRWCRGDRYRQGLRRPRRMARIAARRAERAATARLIRDQSWPDARASAEALSKMTVDDLLVAIEGGVTETTETVDWGPGGNAFSPARAVELARAPTEPTSGLSAITLIPLKWTGMTSSPATGWRKTRNRP